MRPVNPFACVRRIVRHAGFVAALCSSLPALAQSDPALGQEVVLMLSRGASIQDITTSYPLQPVSQFGSRPIWRLSADPGVSVTAVIADLQIDPRVRFAEPNFAARTPEARRNVVWAIGGSEIAWGTQWALQDARLTEAHAVTAGSGVRVAVLDTGIDRRHPIFEGRLALRANGRVLGRDFVDGDNDPGEGADPTLAGWGHGTHVAGLVALAAPQATIMPVRVLDPHGVGNVWVLAEALMWAVDPDARPATDDGAHVVNMSLGTTRRTRLLDAAVSLATCSAFSENDNDDDDDDDDEAALPVPSQVVKAPSPSDIDVNDNGYAVDRARCRARPGVVVVAGAGNDGTRARQYPAAEAVPGSMAVAASTSQGRLARFSNRGNWVDIAAPGDGIISALPGRAWGTWSGTSMSTPLVSGVAALVRQLRPLAAPEAVVRSIVNRGGNLCGSSMPRLDAYSSVMSLNPPIVPCP